MISAVVSVLIVGAMISAIYALVAIGFTMIFGVAGVLNLTHGVLLMIGAYAFLVASWYLPIPTLVLFVIGIVAAAGVSYAIYAGLVRFIEEHVVITFMATLMLALAIQEAAKMAFSPQARILPALIPGRIQIAGTRVLYDQIFAFVLSWVVIGILWYYVTNTKNGRAILATSMTERGSILSGVSISRVKRDTWIIAGGLAGLAGVFLGGLQQTSPEMWLEPLALAFIIVIVGGVGSIKGSIVAAYLIGYLETITVAILGAPYRGLISLLIVTIVILFRPEGLFGREFVE